MNDVLMLACLSSCWSCSCVCVCVCVWSCALPSAVHRHYDHLHALLSSSHALYPFHTYAWMLRIATDALSGRDPREIRTVCVPYPYCVWIFVPTRSPILKVI